MSSVPAAPVNVTLAHDDRGRIWAAGDRRVFKPSLRQIRGDDVVTGEVELHRYIACIRDIDREAIGVGVCGQADLLDGAVGRTHGSVHPYL